MNTQHICRRLDSEGAALENGGMETYEESILVVRICLFL